MFKKTQLLIGMTLISGAVFQNCSSSSSPSSPGPGGTGATTVSCPLSPTSAPQNLTLGALDAPMVNTIGAKGGLYTQQLQTSSGLSAAGGDCVNSLTAPDGTQVQVLVKVPAPANPAVYNVPPYPMASGQTVLDYLSSAINYAMGSNPSGTIYSSVVFPTATYEVEDFAGCDDGRGSNGYNHWQISNATDLIIDGQGSTLDFNGLCEGVEIDWGQRVIFKNFTLQWSSVQLAALGTIQSINSGSNPTMNILVDSQYPVNSNTIVEAITAWDRTNSRFSLQDPYDDEGMAPNYMTYLGNQTIKAAMFVSTFHVGESVILRYFGGEAPALTINDSQDVIVQNVNVYNATGSAFFLGLDRGFLLLNSQVARLPGALISIAGDAIHMAGLKGDIDIENNNIGYQGDDGLNLLASMWCSSTTSGSNFQPCNPYLAGAAQGAISSYTIFSWWENIWTQGDVLGFLNSNLQYMAATTVSGATMNPNVSTTVTLSSPSPAQASFLVDLTHGGARYIIRNNTFSYNRARGLLLQTGDGLVEGNTLTGQTMHAILLNASPAAGEGPGTQNLTIANNTISNVGNYVEGTAPWGAVLVSTEDASGNTIAAHVPIHQNIIFSGNHISNVPGPGFFVSTANNVILSQNILNNTNQVTSTTVNYGTANSNGSVVITDADNIFYQGNQMTGTSGPVSIDTGTTSGISGH